MDRSFRELLKRCFARLCEQLDQDVAGKVYYFEPLFPEPAFDVRPRYFCFFTMRILNPTLFTVRVRDCHDLRFITLLPNHRLELRGGLFGSYGNSNDYVQMTIMDSEGFSLQLPAFETRYCDTVMTYDRIQQALLDILPFSLTSFHREEEIDVWFDQLKEKQVSNGKLFYVSKERQSVD